MAVVPDKVSLYEQKLSTLKTNKNIVLEALQQVCMTRLPKQNVFDTEVIGKDLILNITC